ncbi:protein O-mannosyl-transferase 2 [Hyalella azteca]|uniref:Protein O-mannosyl-transferase 2 n=1 Tax=Hyalella azteca TaxID=294128 RepID=A0A8B7PF22_HYAAZ|nr:protein O-mannosyl-transferase 2 [Hyalella azteca]
MESAKMSVHQDANSSSLKFDENLEQLDRDYVDLIDSASTRKNANKFVYQQILLQWDAFRSPRPSNSHWWGTLMLIVGASLATRLWGLSTPDVAIWDENHFGRMIGLYINRSFFFDVHPAGGKLLLTLVAAAGGYEGTHSFAVEGHKITGHRGIIFTRAACAVLGAALAPLAFGVAWTTTRRLPPAFLAGLLVVCETGTLLLTRFILLDAPLMFFMMAVFFSLCRLQHATLRQGAFSGPWWTSLGATGLFLGCVVSVKFVGLFTVAVVGLHAASQLWHIFPRASAGTLVKHFSARLVCFVFLPLLIYVSCFIIHDFILHKTEDKYEFHLSHFSPSFQMAIDGAALNNISQASEVTYGALLTLRNAAIGGGFLTSFNSTYPANVLAHRPIVVFSGRQKLPVNFLQIQYPEDDPDTDAGQYSGPAEAVVAEDQIRIFNPMLGLYFAAHPAYRSPVSTANFLVYAERKSDDDPHPSNHLWEVQVIGEQERVNTGKQNAGFNEEKSTIAEDPRRWRVLESRVRLRNLAANCCLCYTGRKMPKTWGLDVHEVSCCRSRQQDGVAWLVEQSNETRLAKKSFAHMKSGLAARFLETHRLMGWMNSQFKPSREELAASSRPWMWPLCSKSQPWHSVGYQVVLLGNPVVFWLNLAGFVFAFVFMAGQAYRIKRKFGTPSIEDQQTYYWCRWLLVAYLLHYLPFYAMDRVLYYHHYFPALQFSSLLTAVVMGRILCKISSSSSLLLMLLLSTTLVSSFWSFSFTAYGVQRSAPYAPHTSPTRHLRWLSSWELI